MTESILSPSTTSKAEEKLMPTLQCSYCQQGYLSKTAPENTTCPECAQGKLTPLSDQPTHTLIEYVIPPQLSKPTLSTLFTNFVKGVWLKPADFSPENLLSRSRTTYFPMWLVDCEVEGEWQAEMGYDYQVKSSREHYRGASWQTQEVIEGRIRWENRLGILNRPYKNHAVPALKRHVEKLQKLGEYDLAKAIPVSEEHVKDALIEKFDLTTGMVWNQAQEQVNLSAEEECQQACEAQHVRNFKLSADYNNKHWTQLLLPILATWYQDDKGVAHPIIVNAQSGRIHGKRMASHRKAKRIAGITALVALGIFLLAFLSALLSNYNDVFVLIFGFLVYVGIIIALGALIPIIWAWQWNNRQKD